MTSSTFFQLPSSFDRFLDLPADIQGEILQKMTLRQIIALWLTSKMPVQNLLNTHPVLLHRFKCDRFENFLGRIKILQDKTKDEKLVQLVLDEGLNLATAELFLLPREERTKKILSDEDIQSLLSFSDNITIDALPEIFQGLPGLEIALFERVYTMEQYLNLVRASGQIADGQHILELLAKPITAVALKTELVTLDALTAMDPKKRRAWEYCWLSDGAGHESLARLRRRANLLSDTADATGLQRRFDALSFPSQLLVIDKIASFPTAEKVDALLNPQKSFSYTAAMPTIRRILEARDIQLSEEELATLNSDEESIDHFFSRTNTNHYLVVAILGGDINLKDLSIVIKELLLLQTRSWQDNSKAKLIFITLFENFLTINEGFIALREGLIKLGDFLDPDYIKLVELGLFLSDNCALLRKLHQFITKNEDAIENLKSRFGVLPTIYKQRILEGVLTFKQAEDGVKALLQVAGGFNPDLFLTQATDKNKKDEFYLLAATSPDKIEAEYKKLVDAQWARLDEVKDDKREIFEPKGPK